MWGGLRCARWGEAEQARPRLEEAVRRGATDVETYDDHRMAMSFAITGLVAPGIRIRNPSCVTKTFPHFFAVLARLREH